MSFPDSTVLDVGAKVADTYEVVRLIGRGGMGEVWLARHLRLPGKQVAIKVLHTRQGGLSDDALARFRREAEVATRIGHPNIVEVHDYNTLPSGAPYLVLEFLQGESLASRLRFGPIPADETMLLLRQVGSALDASHALGVVHRDLKPDNIFLVPTPMGTQVKVLDFGISKVVDSTTLQTADEVLVGTPQYMSPEQAIGNNKDVGPQTDVFALGSIAYEMLTGAPPFTADSVAKVVFRIAYEPHVPLSQVKPGLEPRVYAAIERALEKDKAKRHESVASFIAELTGSPVPRTAPPPAAVSQSAGSGVALPGMATPDSIAWGKTAAPAASTAAAPKPFPTFAAVGLVVAIAAGGAAVWLLSRPPPPVVVAVKEQPVKPVAVAVVAPVADAAVAEVAEVVDAGVVQPVARPPKKIPADDLALINEMEARFSSQAPLQRVLQPLRDLKSEAGLQRAYEVAGKTACRDHDLGSARSYLGKLDDRSERQRLIADCKKLGTELIE